MTHLSRFCTNIRQSSIHITATCKLLKETILLLIKTTPEGFLLKKNKLLALVIYTQLGLNVTFNVHVKCDVYVICDVVKHSKHVTFDVFKFGLNLP